MEYCSKNKIKRFLWCPFVPKGLCCAGGHRMHPLTGFLSIHNRRRLFFPETAQVVECTILVESTIPRDGLVSESSVMPQTDR
eukprot:g40389.t1